MNLMVDVEYWGFCEGKMWGPDGEDMVVRIGLLKRCESVCIAIVSEVWGWFTHADNDGVVSCFIKGTGVTYALWPEATDASSSGRVIIGLVSEQGIREILFDLVSKQGSCGLLFGFEARIPLL